MSSLVEDLRRFRSSADLSIEDFASYLRLRNQVDEAYLSYHTSPAMKPAEGEGKSRKGRKSQKSATPEGEAVSEQSEAVES